MKKSTSLAQAFWTAMGFTDIGTGGNCTAWERTLAPIGDGAKPIQILITDGDNMTPQHLGESHSVGLYWEGDGEHFAYTDAPSAEAAVVWLLVELALQFLEADGLRGTLDAQSIEAAFRTLNIHYQPGNEAKGVALWKAVAGELARRAEERCSSITPSL